MTILDRIADKRGERVAEARARVSLEELRARCADAPPALDVIARIETWPSDSRPVIAEIKRRSPSKGDLAPDLDPGALARSYEEAGVFAISVLIEPDFFGGGLGDMDAARSAVATPLLYKDFVVDPYQLWEARAHGADMALLIVALLGERTGQYVELARSAGVEPLVEVHTVEERDIALASGARFVGVNNRNLKTFEVDLGIGERILAGMGGEYFGVGESGIRTTADMDRLERAGARAFLIGESFVTATDTAAKLGELVRR